MSEELKRAIERAKNSPSYKMEGDEGEFGSNTLEAEYVTPISTKDLELILSAIPGEDLNKAMPEGMSEELKEAVQEVLEQVLVSLERVERETDVDWDRRCGVLISRKRAAALLTAFPKPNAVAVFPAPIPISSIVLINKALKQAFGPGLLVKPYAVGGFQLTKPTTES